jgi:tRNA-specific 2-thiouridylase
MEMAEKHGVKEYPTPAGGCLLTDSIFSNRLKDILFVQKDYEKRELYLLKHGRHFRVNNELKVIVGRSKEDNDNILKYYREDKDILINPASLPGPAVLIVSGKITGKEEEIGGLLCASYTKAKSGETTGIQIVYPDKEKSFQVIVRHHSEFKKLMI